MQPVEKHEAKEKYSNLLAAPAAIFKKLSFNSSQIKTEQEIVSAEQEESNTEDSLALAKTLTELVFNTERLFSVTNVFDSVKKLANEVTNTTEANHVLLALMTTMNHLSDEKILDSHNDLFAIPGIVIDNFNFPEDYKDKSKKLKIQCEGIHNVLDFKENIKNVFELVNCVYEESSAQKEELESFLFNVCTQISRIGDDLHCAVEAQTEDLQKQSDLNAKMNDAVSDIDKNVFSANNLDELKHTVKFQLDSLQSLVEEERQVVKEHEIRVKQSVHVLAKEVDALKSEAKVLKEKVKKEKENALRDPLTGLLNREAYDKKISDLIISSKKNRTVMSLLIWDVDRFKKFNDSYGHVIGDKVLKTVSKKLNQSLKSSYFLSRYGGEEFVMLLPDTTESDAVHFANQVREQISHITFLFKGKSIKVTISCGIAVMHEEDCAESIFERADKALYEAKNSGRNRVRVGKSITST